MGSHAEARLESPPPRQRRRWGPLREAWLAGLRGAFLVAGVALVMWPESHHIVFVEVLVPTRDESLTALMRSAWHECASRIDVTSHDHTAVVLANREDGVETGIYDFVVLRRDRGLAQLMPR